MILLLLTVMNKTNLKAEEEACLIKDIITPTVT